MGNFVCVLQCVSVNLYGWVSYWVGGLVSELEAKIRITSMHKIWLNGKLGIFFFSGTLTLYDFQKEKEERCFNV